ncbi:MAG: hypothetical protein COB98_00165 [Flavobacteriaceae bacterium]|nr:MAG: hypothetical protein COB98_00165 [Flavobacteriaceae bacterium]
MEKQKLPHAQSSLVFGIISIVTACCCLGLPGFIFGLIGWSNSKKAYALLEQNPDEYEGEGNANTGKITSIIGMVIGALIVLNIVYSIATTGWSEMIEQFQQAMEQAQQQ